MAAAPDGGGAAPGVAAGIVADEALLAGEPDGAGGVPVALDGGVGVGGAGVPVVTGAGADGGGAIGSTGVALGAAAAPAPEPTRMASTTLPLTSGGRGSEDGGAGAGPRSITAGTTWGAPGGPCTVSASVPPGLTASGLLKLKTPWLVRTRIWPFGSLPSTVALSTVPAGNAARLGGGLMTGTGAAAAAALWLGRMTRGGGTLIIARAGRPASRQPDGDVSRAAIARMSSAASVLGKRASSGVCVRITSTTLRSRRTTPASGGEKRRKFSQALSSVA